MTRDPIKSATRALEVFECFSKIKRPMRQSEIVQTLGYPQSSTVFLLKSLIQAGYLSYDRGARLYKPTPEVIKLGAWMEQRDYDFFFGRGAFTRLLEELRSLTNETVAVAMQNDIFVHWHRLLESGHDLTCHIPAEGKLYPLTYSSHGWMLLSVWPDESVEMLVRLINAREPDRERRVGVGQAIEVMQRIRAQGHYFTPSSYYVGLGSVATLLPWRLDDQPMTIGVGGLVEQIEPQVPRILDQIAEVVEKHGASVSATLERVATDHQDLVMQIGVQPGP